MRTVGRSLIVYLRDLGNVPETSEAVSRIVGIDLRNAGTAQDHSYFGWGHGALSTVSLERKAEPVWFERDEPVPALRLCFTVRSGSIEHELAAEVEPLVMRWARDFPKEWSARMVGWAEESPMREGKTLHMDFPGESDVGKLAIRVASRLGIELFEDVSGHFEEFPAFVGVSDGLRFNLLGPPTDRDESAEDGASCSLDVVIEGQVTKYANELAIQDFIQQRLALDPRLTFEVVGWSE